MKKLLETASYRSYLHDDNIVVMQVSGNFFCTYVTVEVDVSDDDDDNVYYTIDDSIVTIDEIDKMIVEIAHEHLDYLDDDDE